MGYEEDDVCPLQNFFGEEEEVISSDDDVCDEVVNDEGFEELPDSISKHSCISKSNIVLTV